MKQKTILSSLLLIIFGAFLTQSCKNLKSSDNVDEEAILAEEIHIPEPKIDYDRIMIDSFEILEGNIKRDQPLSILLGNLGVSNSAINEAVIKSQGIFNLRKIQSGRPYLAFFKSDSVHNIDYFVYEHSPLEYLVFQFKDSVDVWTGQKQVDTVNSFFAASIESSLWNSMIEKDANPMLAIELSEIYAWSIDFFGLQQGDSLRVIYDEYFVDSTSIGIGKIYGAYFNHMNANFWAIPFEQDSVLDFYEEDGKSLRKAFLKAPLRFSRISSRFSNSRLHPILKIRRPHHGVDYAAPVGTPVNAIGDGVVIQKEYNGGAGYMLKIKHNSVYTTAYLHLSKYGEGIKMGSYVKQGQVIGYVGSSGLSTGPHLDFRFYKNGAAIDPLKVEAPPVSPVREENMENFNEVKIRVMNEVRRGK
ncbi:MAG: peptidoglycan DD-metalloendopeptidase family protein [Bacteroidales bacterium]|nr:peptidoglycan DD-metalloendopeptidase family protein [Bacteroidales bacterium]MCF8390119.1 peptidoglycan DD-metalloendopeptidase family protein [Bacteroidales bacterium]